MVIDKARTIYAVLTFLRLADIICKYERWLHRERRSAVFAAASWEGNLMLKAVVFRKLLLASTCVAFALGSGGFAGQAMAAEAAASDDVAVDALVVTARRRSGLSRTCR